MIRPRNVTILSSTPLLTSICLNSLKSTALCTATTFDGSMPYLLITMFLVRLLTAIILSAASIPIFSSAKTLGSIALSLARSNEVACTWITSGLPEIFLAAIPAAYVSQSCAWITSKSFSNAIALATIAYLCTSSIRFAPYFPENLYFPP